MKVMCITRREYSTFTIEPGEWYEVYITPYILLQNSEIDISPNYIIEKNGHTCFCNKDFFITLEEYREQQLNKIL